MELYVLDTVSSWECVDIKQIVLMNEEYFIYVVYKEWSTKWNEWIPISSARLTWMKSKQGQLVDIRPRITSELVQPGQYLDFLQYLPSCWVSAQVVRVIDKDIEIDLIGGSRIVSHYCRSVQLAPHGTFT